MAEQYFGFEYNRLDWAKDWLNPKEIFPGKLPLGSKEG
jgi:hypothetical protein